VEHSEPAAFIDVNVLAVQAEVTWAEQVEQNMHALQICAQQNGGTLDSTEIAALIDVTAPSERIYLLRYSSAPSGGGATKRARTMLLNGPELRPCRDALAAAGFEFLAPWGPCWP